MSGLDLDNRIDTTEIHPSISLELPNTTTLETAQASCWGTAAQGWGAKLGIRKHMKVQKKR
jgi:hypothetical protein